MKSATLLRAFVATCVLSAPGVADILMLEDGRVVENHPMHRVEAGIEVKFEHGTVLIPKAMVHDAVLEEDKAWTPKTDEEKAQTEKGFVRFEGKWVTPRQREDLVLKRVMKHKKEVEEMKAHREWRNRQILDTKYFRFEYTLPQHIFEPYRDAMEAYFNDFAKTWKLKTPKNDERLPVCFYVDEDSFHQIGGVPPNVLGYFRFVKPWDLNIFYERLDPGQTEDTMFHEANHYLQQLIDQRFAYPHFPGESLAEYYGASSWDPEKKKLVTGLIQEGRLCEVQTDLDAGTKQSLAALISTDRLYEHYTWGWTLVHFLMNDPRYQAKFVKFFLSLPDAKGIAQAPGPNGMHTMKSEDVLTVFMRELGLKDANALRKLEAEWYDYIEGKLKLIDVTGIEKAGFAAKQAGRTLRATRLFNEAVEKGSKNALVFKDLAELLAGAGKPHESIAMYKKALEIDPLNGEFYYRLAQRLEAGDADDKAECARLKGLAKEIGYDDVWEHIEFEGKPKDPGGPGGPGGSGDPGKGEPPPPQAPGDKPH